MATAPGWSPPPSNACSIPIAIPTCRARRSRRGWQRDLGFDRVLWLGDGLLNDHTDGHVDNLARFVGPNRLALPRATGPDDPNAAIYADAKARAEAFGVEVAEIPSPGLITRADFIEPASYANFAITTNLVVVPTFGSVHDADGVAAIAALFPDRATDRPARRRGARRRRRLPLRQPADAGSEQARFNSGLGLRRARCAHGQSRRPCPDDRVARVRNHSLRAGDRPVRWP